MLEFMGWQRVRSDLANEQPKFAMQIRKRTAFHAEGTAGAKAWNPGQQAMRPIVELNISSLLSVQCDVKCGTYCWLSNLLDEKMENLETEDILHLF